MLLQGARCAVSPNETVRASVEVYGERISHIQREPQGVFPKANHHAVIDLSGFLVMPGLINAHDHLQFALFPKLGCQTYRNYIEWGNDIHISLSHVITEHKRVPKDVRLWWGGIRNLLCGVTTVCHHDLLWPALLGDKFPIRVVRQYGWAHSPSLSDDDIVRAWRNTPEQSAFIMHACEGVDELARDELFYLDRLGVLDAATVLVHGLAIDATGAVLLKKRQASLIVCPSSNQFLFAKLPDKQLIDALQSIALGSDSPLTATGDLLDEVQFAIQYCDISPAHAYRMVTETAAGILRLKDGEGMLRASGPADLIAVRDEGSDAAERLSALTMADIELVMIKGKIQLASNTIYELMPSMLRQSMEELWIDGCIRWLRAPVKDLLREAEAVLGPGNVRLGGRTIGMPDAIDFSKLEGLKVEFTGSRRSN